MLIKYCEIVAYTHSKILTLDMYSNHVNSSCYIREAHFVGHLTSITLESVRFHYRVIVIGMTSTNTCCSDTSPQPQIVRHYVPHLFCIVLYTLTHTHNRSRLAYKDRNSQLKVIDEADGLPPVLPHDLM